MIRKETKYTLGLLTFLFAGSGGFFNYLDRSIGSEISLSPGVVTAVLLILLVIGAISILWVVVSNFVKQGAESIELGVNTLKLDIKSASFVQDKLEISVERGGVKGNVSGVRIVLEDITGKAVAFTDNTAFLEFETKTVTITEDAILAEGLAPGSLVKISVYPTITNSEGKVFEGTVEDQIQIVDGEVIIDNSPTRTPISDITNGLIGYYSFNDGTATDNSGSENDGGISSGLDCSGNLGKRGNGCTFGTSGDRILLGIVDGINAQQGTILAWAYPTDIGSNDYVFSASGDEPGRMYIQWANNHDLNINRGAESITLASGPELLNQWHHPAMTWSSNGDLYEVDVKGYLDGVLVTESLDVTITDTTPANAKIGTQNVGSEFIGSIDEVRIYNRALTPNEIAYIHKYH